MVLSMSANEFTEVPAWLDVKFHKAKCVKSDYNRMEPFPIGEL